MNQTDNSLQSPGCTNHVRKTWRKPELRVYGNVATLTQNMACGGNDGPAGQVLS